jgi:hypothetical protein
LFLYLLRKFRLGHLKERGHGALEFISRFWPFQVFRLFHKVVTMKESDTPQGQDSTSEDAEKGKNSGPISEGVPLSTKIPPTINKDKETKAQKESMMWSRLKKQITIALTGVHHTPVCYHTKGTLEQIKIPEDFVPCFWGNNAD